MNRLLTTVSILLTGLQAFCVTVTIYVSPARCGLDNGSASAVASGGLPPYTYSWASGQTTSDIYALAPGDYTVTVTDGLGNTAQAMGTVNAVYELEGSYFPFQLQPDCNNMCTGIVTTQVPLGGTLPYTYPPNVFEAGNQLTIMGICASMPISIPISDANGCPGTIDVNGVVMPVSPSVVTVQSATPACAGQSNGTMTLLITGGSASVVDVVHLGGAYSQTHYPALMIPYVVNDLPAGNYQITSSIVGGGGPPLCSATFGGTVPQISAPCGGVNGRVYHDADQNCTYDGFDLPIPNKVLEILPGPGYAITASDGTYTQGLPFDDFTIGQELNNETQVCPVINPAPFTLSASATQAVVDFANVSATPHDLAVHVSHNTARPGFSTQVFISVTNNSPFPSGDVTLDLSFDGLLLNPLPGNGQWNLGIIAPFTWVTRSFSADVPANINLLGTVLSYTATVTNSLGEANTANNTTSVEVTITGSYDPNDKQGNTSSRLSDTQYFLAQDEWIDYTVRFQNTGTAAAETVVIRDTLDDDLFIPSLEILGASHAFTPSFGAGRELIFTFDNIDLPDSTTDLLGSQGFISFRLKPNNDIVVGDLLENTAGIYFDFNPPIITNTTSHVVDFSTGDSDHVPPTLRAWPNPANDVLYVSTSIVDTRQVDILSMDGRRISVPTHRSANNVQLDVRSLAPGCYLARSGTGTLRFIKD